MTDQSRPTPSEPISPVDESSADPFSTGARGAGAAAGWPAASFRGSTPHKTAAVRAGMIVGTALLVVIGAAVAMGASPAPSSSGTSPEAVPGQGGAPGNGGPSGGRFGPFGPFGGFGGFGPLAPGDPGKPFGGPGPAAGRGFGQIMVTGVSGSSITLATDDGWTRTITVTGATTITKGGAAATAADLSVGDIVRLSQTRNADGTYTITAISIVLPQVAGTVTAVGADTITITLRDGTSQTIRTTASTAYHLEQADGQRSDVTVGSTIVATGDKAADGGLTASSVWVQLPRVAGTVTAISGDTITLSRRDGTTMTIHVGTGTTIRVAGVDNAKLSNITTGMAIAVEGTQRADGSIDARAIGAGKVGKGLGNGLGKGLGHDRQPGLDPNGSPAPNASSGTTG